MSEPNSTETAMPVPPTNRPLRIGNFRSSAAQFLSALILMLFAAPFVDGLDYGDAIDTALITLVLIMGVLAAGRSHRTLVLAVMLMLPAVLSRWIWHFQPALLPASVQNIAALIFIAFVEFELLHFIFRAPRVNSEVLCAGVSGYLLLGVLWMSAYMAVSRLHPVNLLHPELNPFAFTVGATTPHPLSQFEAYYFSFITLSTVGYGDITPLSSGARTLAMMEAMTGTLYMAVLISRLVALYSSQGSEMSEPSEKKIERNNQ
jgi:Ion channel